MVDEPQFVELIGALARGRVRCVVIGGVAAVLAGAPVVTLDLDVLVETGEANLRRLLELLDALDARYDDPAGRELRPSLERLGRNRMNLLRTRHGRLDVATEIGDGVRYGEARDRSSVVEIAGLPVRVLDLDLVIETKAFANREKDRAALPMLRETLRMIRGADPGS